MFLETVLKAVQDIVSLVQVVDNMVVLFVEGLKSLLSEFLHVGVDLNGVSLAMAFDDFTGGTYGHNTSLFQNGNTLAK